MAKYTVRAQRVEFADVVLVIPDHEEPTGQRVQEELNKDGGQWIIANVPRFTDWLPTSQAQLVKEEVAANE